MDEYLITPDKPVSYDDPISFHYRMNKEFYELVDRELIMPENQRLFPEPGKEEEYDKLFESDNFLFRTPLFKNYDQRHYISDNNGNILYKIKVVKTLPHVFNIYDAYDNELGKVECDIFNNETNKLEVEVNNKSFTAVAGKAYQVVIK